MVFGYGVRLFTAAALVVAFGHGFAAGEDWTRFRGENGSGVVASANVPSTWSETSNLRWSVELPGPGSSSPIVLGDRAYVTCYTGYGVTREDAGDVGKLERHLICFDLKKGKEIWRATVAASEAEDEWKGFIQEHGFASSTPATDGKRIFMQCGKTGLAAFDLDGKQLWIKPMGAESDPYKWGDGASPIVWNDLVIANAGITGHKIMAFKADSGEVAWEHGDESFTNNWSTPILVKTANREELVCAAPGSIFGLDPATGKQLWTAKSTIDQTVCGSLVQHDGAVFLMGGQKGDAIGIRCGGDGDVSETHTLWTGNLRSGICTPVVIDGRMYWSSQGMAFCASCETGEEIFRERIKVEGAAEESAEGQKRSGPAGDYASPIAVGNRILVIRAKGQSQWWEASKEYLPSGDSEFASDKSLYNGTPAVAGDAILIRSNKKLYCVSKVDDSVAK